MHWNAAYFLQKINKLIIAKFKVPNIDKPYD